MTSKHTPGPWKYGVRRDKSIWLSIGDPAKGPHRQGDLHASEADAQLIAAAPDLLATLKSGNFTYLGDEYVVCLKAHVVEAAIAKAEGRS